jgi:hypothetical protein
MPHVQMSQQMTHPQSGVVQQGAPTSQAQHHPPQPTSQAQMGAQPAQMAPPCAAPPAQPAQALPPGVPEGATLDANVCPRFLLLPSQSQMPYSAYSTRPVLNVTPTVISFRDS